MGWLSRGAVSLKGIKRQGFIEIKIASGKIVLSINCWLTKLQKTQVGNPKIEKKAACSLINNTSF